MLIGFCEKRMRIIKQFLLVVGLGLVVSACESAVTLMVEPTQVAQTTRAIATSVATPTTIPTLAATPTVAPMPTAFVTAPALGETAIVPILMYHHVVDLPANASELQQTWTVAPKNFDAQMQWIAEHGFHSITMAQLVGHLKQRQPLPAKPIIISFDDGWVEQYATAFPILKKYGLGGAFFIYTNPVARNGFVTWAQLQEMSAAGMDIQSHSLSHPHLRALAPEAAQKEITDSKMLIEQKLGKPVIAFDYPDGEYNSAVIEMVKRAGYTCAVTIAAGDRQRADELFTLHRTRVSYTDTLESVVKRLPK
jgi:peptidoglycan/xylan/chitin deacetylase (PgdA/CDA1 family)